MHIVGFLNSKGGVGKSTLCAAIAVRAAKDNPRIAVMDLDPQASLADWWTRRGRPDNPELFRGADRASDAIEALELAGFDWCFLDGPPGATEVTEDAASIATFVVVPMRASGLDLFASANALATFDNAEVPYFVVLNAVKSGKADRMQETVSSTLFTNNIRVAKTTITQRASFASAMMIGRSGAEKDAAAADEIDALWREIKAATLKAAKARAMKEAAE